MTDQGAQKGAILMLALGENEAAEVMKYLGPREVQKLGQAMASMKAVGVDQVESVLDSFCSQADRNSTFALDSDQPMLFHRTVGLRDEWANIQKRS